MEHVIYGDGYNKVAVTENQVIITRHDAHSEEESVIVFGRKAFREVVLGWDRLRDQEEEQEG